MGSLVAQQSSLLWVFAAVAGVLLIWLSGAVRYIPNTRVAVVEKLWSAHGSLRGGFIAMRGEAGFQQQVLRGGWHLFFPFQFRVHRLPLVTIPQGKIGYVFARDGIPLPATQALASNAEAKDFTNVGGFLAGNGQRGPQRQILREGTYAINLAQFVVITEDGLDYLPMDREEEQIFRRMAEIIAARDGFRPVIITDDLVGIVTVHDGPALPQGEVIAPTVGDKPTDENFHNDFQDPERFLKAGGMRGRQLQVLVEGTYFLNRLFATVELIPKTVVEVGHVGVVVSYTGELGPDLSGQSYRHGEMVSVGKRGVWQTPLLPGKYPFNTYAGNVIMVPTTNFILKWIRNETGAHKFDENLSEVSLITKDAFEPSLPLSVVVHIDYQKAPLVIQQFGDIKRLVEQTLDPMVSAYFKNVGQTRTLIQLLQDRANIQEQSAEQMKAKFDSYSLELKEVLIGTPQSAEGNQVIEQILQQLRARQIAEEQVETYSRQEKAAVKERELREAEARAKQQTVLTQSEIGIAVSSNQGKAEYQRSLQQAAQIKALAEAEGEKVRLVAVGEASRVRVLGEAEAEKAARVGIGQALAIEEQVRAYGGPQLQLTQQVMGRFAEAIERSGVDVVPRVLVAGKTGTDGGAGGGQGSIFEALLAMLLADRAGAHVDAARAPISPEVEATRTRLRAELMQTLQQPSNGAATPPPLPQK